MKFLNLPISLLLWTIGGIFFIFSFFILVFCLFILPRPVTFSTAQVLFKILIRIMGIDLNVTGRENIRPNTTYLLMGNHQSLFDLFVIPAAIPLCFTGVEAAEHFRLPVWGYLIKKWGVIPIQRDDLKKALNSLKKAREALSSGMSVCILPEGHRTRDGKIRPFKKGPFYLARQSGADILPFGIRGLYEYQSKGALILRPGKVTVSIGEPLPFNQITGMDEDAVRRICYEKIADLAGQTGQKEN